MGGVASNGFFYFLQDGSDNAHRPRSKRGVTGFEVGKRGEGKQPGALTRLRWEHSIEECCSMQTCDPTVLNLAVLVARKVVPLQECTKQGRTYKIADKLANRILC